MAKKVFVTIDTTPWKDYTGSLGGYYFENGRSKDALPIRAALRIGSNMEAFDEDGLRLHPSTYPMIDQPGSIPAPSSSLEVEGSKPLPVYEPVSKVEDVPTIDLAPTREVQADGTIKVSYTRAQLEAIADKKGINGLREISDPLNVKGRSVTELIDKIVEAQA